MRDSYVEIIGQVQSATSIKMFAVLNLGNNIGKNYVHDPMQALMEQHRHGRCESHHRTHAYSYHGCLLVHEDMKTRFISALYFSYQVSSCCRQMSN